MSSSAKVQRTGDQGPLGVGYTDRQPATRTGGRSLGRVAAAAILACAAIGAAVVACAQTSLEWGITAVLLAAAASLRAVYGSPQARRSGMFLPFSFIGLWVIGYGLASIAWRKPTADMLAQNGAQLTPGSLPFGLALAAGGLLAWTAGYVALHLRLVQKGISSVRQWSTSGVGGLAGVEYSVGRIVSVYAVGLGARLALLAFGRYSYITADLQGSITQSSPATAILSQLEFLSTVGLLLLAYVCFRTRSTTAKRLLTVALMLEIPFGLLSGMRSFILLRLVGVAITYVLVRGRVPMLASVALLGLLAILSPFTDAYRGQVRDATGTTVDAAGAAKIIPKLLSSTIDQLSPGDVIAGPIDFVTKRLRFVDEVGIVGQRSPSEIAYVPASDTLVEATTVMIPRALWAGKPVYTTGLQYARDFWNQPESIVSARSPTYAGDGYYRGGWVGLICLMALLGGLMAAVNTSLSPRLHPAAIPMFIVAWTALVNIEGSLSLLGAGLVQSLLITAVAMRCASSGRRGALARSSPSVLTAGRR